MVLFRSRPHLTPASRNYFAGCAGPSSALSRPQIGQATTPQQIVTARTLFEDSASRAAPPITKRR